jgi:hypothetical protein
VGVLHASCAFARRNQGIIMCFTRREADSAAHLCAYIAACERSINFPLTLVEIFLFLVHQFGQMVFSCPHFHDITFLYHCPIPNELPEILPLLFNGKAKCEAFTLFLNLAAEGKTKAILLSLRG